MRAIGYRAVAASALVGAAAGALVAAGVHWWAVRHMPDDFGWFSYSPLPNAANGGSLSVEFGPGLWSVLWPAVIVGALVGALLGVLRGRVLAGLGRAAAVLAAAGILLGVAVGVVFHARATTGDGETTYHGRYVPMNGTELPKAYTSSLDVTLYGPGAEWFPMLWISAGLGLATGLLALGAVVVIRRARSRPDPARVPSATGS